MMLYGPHIQPRHAVLTHAPDSGVTTVTPCHPDAHTYVNGQRIHQTAPLQHGSLVKFGHSNTYRFVDPQHEDRQHRVPQTGLDNGQARLYDSRSPRALSPTDPVRENIETTFDLEGNVETVSTTSGAREDNRSLGSSSENRLSGIDRYPRGQDPILPAVLEFPEEPQEQFLARVITHLDVTTPTFRLAPAYTLYLCARYRASTHYRPELTPTERAHKLTLLLQHAAMLIRHTVQDRSTDGMSQAFWLANASELLHFLKSDRHVSAFSLQAQDTLADAVQLAFKNLVACLTDELGQAMSYLMSVAGDDHPREIINTLSSAMNLLRKCRVNAALTIQLFSQLFHWISAKALAAVVSNANLCTRHFGVRLGNRLRNLQAWAESQGLELAAECHLAKIVQCAHLLQAPKYAPEDLANLSAVCFKLNSMQVGALLMQYKPEPNEKIAAPSMLEQASKAAESVADELARAEGREVALFEEPAPALQLLLPDDGYSCDVVQGVPPGLADFLHPLQAAGLCRLAAQPTSSGQWTVYMNAPRPPSALSTTQPEVQVIRLHKSGGGMGLSIVAAKGAGQERLGIYIKSVVAGGAADRDGRLAAGDQLLSVDGQSLLGITQEKAAEFLQRTGSVVTLEVAKAGAVYHGLATLLQQPSPTPPHRAVGMDSYYCDTVQSSQESLYSPGGYRIFTPPATKPKHNIFFNSDDSLFKQEKRKFTIPRIEIETDEPVFNLQVTDFSEPSPKNVTLTYDETGQTMLTQEVQEVKKSWKDKANNFVQRKSYTIDIHDSAYDIDDIDDTDKFLSISARNRRQNRLASSSLQDLSSSTSSINSCIHESNLDLSQIDPDTPVKHKNWRSPYEIRHGKVKDLSQQFKSKAISVPQLYKRKFATSRSKSVSEEKLNDKLTEYERLEILKLLHDWSLNGSDSKSEFNLKLSKECIGKENACKDDAPVKKTVVKFISEPDLSPKNKKFGSSLSKFKSEESLSQKSNLDQFSHRCEFKNCIFNVDFTPTLGTKTEDLKVDDSGKPKLKGILKTNKAEVKTTEEAPLKINKEKDEAKLTSLPKKPKYRRRFSEIIEYKPFNSQLVRCDSLERLTEIQRKHKKFPDAYIITRRNSARKSKSDNGAKPPKVILMRKKYLAKAWKSCSDIKSKRTVRKCCRYAKKSCPVSKYCPDSPKVSRKSQSCASIEREGVVEVDAAARLAALDLQVAAYRRKTGPRRMSERDLPSKVDQERAIPASKSVPALHQIHAGGGGTGAGGDPSRPPLYQPPAPEAYGRPTAGSAAHLAQNGGAPGLRSRSTHNLHQQQQQQQDGGFYQNLSIYRNKVPSPQHLGDRTSVLRSSQNSLHSSVANSAQQRPASAYYPPAPATAISRPPGVANHLHQSIPNLKSPPSTHRLHGDEQVGRTGSYPNVQGYYTATSTATPYQRHYATEDGKMQYYGNHTGQSYPSPTHNGGYGNGGLQQPLHINPNVRQEEVRYSNTGGGLLREDVFRQSERLRHEEMMSRYPSQPAIHTARLSDLPTDRLPSEIRPSKSDDALKHHAAGEIARYASSGNVAKVQYNNQQRDYYQQQYYNHMMSQNAQSMQNLSINAHSTYNQTHQQQYSPQQGSYSSQQNSYSSSQQNSYPPQQNSYQNPLSPTYKTPPVAPKPHHKKDDVPEPPPTSTHPLYSASLQDPPKMAFYPTARDPWQREEQERQQEARREAARQWQEQQIRELAALPRRTPHQEEQLRVLQLEREFQRRAAMEAAELDDDDTEKESPSPKMPSPSPPLQPITSPSIVSSLTSSSTSKLESSQIPPASILKPNGSALNSTSNGLQQQPHQQQISHSQPQLQQPQQQQQQPQQQPQPQQQHSPTESLAQPPAPPERGSSFAVMSMRVKETPKRVSFNDTSANSSPPQQQQHSPQSPQQSQPPTTLQLEETVREDPNSFIRQAESMLASPATPTDPSGSGGIAVATPGVIGAQEVYRDPRARRLAEQAQQKDKTRSEAVPEKLSFKEKMKMFAMETGEPDTPKDKSKISRAQREIDNISTPSSSLVH
nr:unnamed protein product [Callosobruchus chinensis]